MAGLRSVIVLFDETMDEEARYKRVNDELARLHDEAVYLNNRIGYIAIPYGAYGRPELPQGLRGLSKMSALHCDFYSGELVETRVIRGGGMRLTPRREQLIRHEGYPLPRSAYNGYIARHLAALESAAEARDGDG